jgi:hypothetical protein
MNRPIKYRNMLVQVLLMIVTLGFYAIYWFYQTAWELKALANDADAEPGLWTVLLFVPFANFYSYYKYGELYQKASAEDFNRWVLFLLWIVFSPVVWVIVQIDLNKRAKKDAAVVQPT